MARTGYLKIAKSPGKPTRSCDPANCTNDTPNQASRPSYRIVPDAVTLTSECADTKPFDDRGYDCSAASAGSYAYHGRQSTQSWIHAAYAAAQARSFVVVAGKKGPSGNGQRSGPVAGLSQTHHITTVRLRRVFDSRSDQGAFPWSCVFPSWTPDMLSLVPSSIPRPSWLHSE